MKGLNSFFLVFIGGGAGASLRYLASLFIKSATGGFPLATFLVNVIGCFVIGLLYNVVSIENQTLKLLLIVGVLGGFTTFSTFGLEGFQLFKNLAYRTAFFYIFLSNICSLAAVYLGVKVSDLRF